MNSVLLDTSFFIRLLNSEDTLHENAKGYYRYFIENEVAMIISTISIAEFCAKGKITDLPLKTLKILPFNYNHACRAGEFMNTIFANKAIKEVIIHPRMIIHNDAKLFAQADTEDSISAFVTSDKRSRGTITLLEEKLGAKFRYIDINQQCAQAYNKLF